MLCAKGLLEARPRVGVRVREREHWRLVDPIVLGWHPDLTADRELILGLIETRRIIEPAAAELAARRGTARDFDAIGAAYLGMERAIPHDLAACCESDLAFHRALIDASHNIVFEESHRHCRNSVARLLSPDDKPDGKPGKDAFSA